jgi:threonine dehydrogenase-like Zn-dependent dehydrogenase
LRVGEHVVGIVRRPDPVPCPNCAVGEWDMCSNGGYTERGIKQLDGFMTERWRIEPEYAVRVDPGLGVLGVLLEPTTVVAKAWEHIASIGRRTFWDPQTVLVVGAGPIGLLGALIAVQHGAEVHVLDRVDSGPKPALVKELGATYHTGSVADVGLRPDIVLECTGVAGLVQQSIACESPGGIVCLTGVGPAGVAAGSAAALATEAVLKNLVVVGSVNANRRHYYRAAKALAAADRGWLAQLITRRVGLEQVQAGLQRSGEDIKVIVEMTRS